MRNALRILVLVLVLAVPAAAAPSTGGPVAKALPAVVGTARVGEQITGTNGTWTGSGTISYTYRWDRCDAPFSSLAVVDCEECGEPVRPNELFGAKIRR